MQYLNMYIKNLRRYFVMEIEVNWRVYSKEIIENKFRFWIVKKCIDDLKYRHLQ
jgi:hypothetical protein